MEPTEPWVYAWPQSVVPGEVVGLRVSGPDASARLEIARIGVRREVVWSGPVDVQPHDIADDARTVGCAWPDAATIQVPASWSSGYYEVTLRTRARAFHEAVGFFVVRAAEPDPSTPLLVLTTDTWNAYNDFGGSDVLTHGAPASFARPMAPGFLRKPDRPGSRVAVVDVEDPDRPRQAHVTYLPAQRSSAWASWAPWPNVELPFVRSSEASGQLLEYATSADLGAVPGLLDGRRLLISVAAEEHWTSSMRDAVERLVAAGGDTVFLDAPRPDW